MIEHDYKVNMMIDNLPALYEDENEEGEKVLSVGHPIGLYNELVIIYIIN